MATSAPIALGVGGIAAVLLISGIQGKSVGSILQGDFGAPPNPAFGKGGAEGEALASQGQSGTGKKGTTEGAEGVTGAANLISPFPKKSKVIWGRSDQGVDGQVEPGSPLLAMGNGTVEIQHNPTGFGANYPVLLIDQDGSYYYGHSVPAVASGTYVKQGQVIAHANTHGQGNATTPGAFEIGKWPPGSFEKAGAAIRSWFINLPRI